MAHRQEEAENHWPGFVDALSTIVMVVTFLLIILGVVIFIIAQQINVTAGTSDIESEQVQQYFEPATSETTAQQIEMLKAEAEAAKAESEQAKAESEQAKAETEQAKAESEQAKAETEQAKAESEQAKAEAEQAKAQQLENQAKINLAEQLRQDRETEIDINGQKVISQEVEETKQITIASDDTARDFKANIVQNADAILTLIFDENSVIIDQQASIEIQKFLTQENIIKQQGQIEIRSYVNLNQASMGEARRKAFYRAMAARNQLLELAVEPSHISIKVKEVDDPKLNAILKIYIKP